MTTEARRVPAAGACPTGVGDATGIGDVGHSPLPSGDWSTRLAAGLFGSPGRWGWQVTADPAAAGSDRAGSAAAWSTWRAALALLLSGGIRGRHHARGSRSSGAPGGRWQPVRPEREPTRVDVIGGDRLRHGWASLLVTVGSAYLASRHRIIVLDLTGHEVGAGLVEVARAAGRRTSMVRLHPSYPSDAYPLADLDPDGIAECLGHVLGDRGADERSFEQESAADLLHRVVDQLNGDVTFARLAAGLRALPRGGGDRAPTGPPDHRVERMSRQLDMLDELTPTRRGRSLWPATAAVCVVATEPGWGDDRQMLVSRMLARLVRPTGDDGFWLGQVLVVAGADQLDSADLAVLTTHARTAGVTVVSMVDAARHLPVADPAGVVCVMKQHDPGAAAVAAGLVGAGSVGGEQLFRLDGMTHRIGASLVGATCSVDTEPAGAQRSGRLSHSRGQVWAHSSGPPEPAEARDLRSDPHHLMNLPETAFLMIDHTGSRTRVTLADCNPGLSRMSADR